MNVSSDNDTPNYTRVEVAHREQGAAYCPGNGDVLFLSDKTTRADLFNNLTEIECMVMAARLSTWADMAAAAADTHSEMAR